MSIDKHTSFRLLIFVAAVAAIFYFLPRSNTRHYYYETNRPWAYSLLTAPFDIPVQRDSVSQQRVCDSIEASFIPVYKRLDAPKAAVLEAVSNATLLPPASRYRLAQIVNELYSSGIVDQATWGQIEKGTLPQIRFIDNSIATNRSTKDLRSQRQAYEAIDRAFTLMADKKIIQSLKISSLLHPNIVIDSAETRRLRAEKLRVATAPIGVVQQGERIIDKGDIVTPELFTLLRTYESMVAASDTAASDARYLGWLGQLVFIAGLLALFYAYLALYRKDIFEQKKQVVCIVGLITGFFIAVSIAARLFAGAVYIVPLAIMPIVMCVFFDSRTATFAYVVEIMLCTAFSAFPQEFLFIEFCAGVTAVFSIKEFSRRSQLIRTAFMVFVVMTVAYCGYELMINGETLNILPRYIGFFGINAVLISFAYLFIFILEKMFGFVSVVTLVELSDINNHTLRELSEKCPGTFQHSMAVSNLASVAAHRIGANEQLIRTGALYHDIGKLDNPAFFTENQHGVNPHVALDPIQSAKIVIRHVTDGLKRAEKAKLPSVISDFIAQHHGRGRARYFYNTYCAAHPDEQVNPEPFTYPGPNPMSREASILMMADSVEAASRSLKEYTLESITELVNRIIDQQIAEGLHKESPISFRDISQIKESFISSLRTMYHARVAYPSEPKQQ